MLVHALPCAQQYVGHLDGALKNLKASAALSTRQSAWLVAVLVGIVVTGVLNWAAFERRSLGFFAQSQLRWMFYRAKIAWPLLLQASTGLVLQHYGICRGVLVIDDTEKRRSKRTRRIAGAHKVKDKKSGGYFNGQELLFMVLVTDVVTIPVAFRWYTPDPALSAWRKQNKQLKAAGVPARERPAKPAPNPDYPSKQALATEMVRAFASDFPAITVQAVLADALYGTGDFMDQASALAGNTQVVSQLRANQLVYSRGRKVNLATYFDRQAGVETTLPIRGRQSVRVTMLAARLYVKAHGKRRFVIALKYEGEADYRYLVASNLSWRHQDIAALYTLRWLVEVFIQDWKGHAGWNRLTKHQGVKGSTRGVTLSLLCDHWLLLHPTQSARLKNKQPGLSTGCLIEHLKAEALVGTIQNIVSQEDPRAAFDAFKQALQETIEERASSKHLADAEMGRMEPSPSLRYQMRE